MIYHRSSLQFIHSFKGLMAFSLFLSFIGLSHISPIYALSLSTGVGIDALNRKIKNLCIENKMGKAEALLLGHIDCVLEMNASSSSERETFERQLHQIMDERKPQSNEDIVDSCNNMDEIVCPNIDTINNVLKGWSKHPVKNESRRADELLTKLGQVHELLSRYDDLDDILPQPNIKSYAFALNSLARTGAAERAEELIISMEKSSVKPDAACYIACVNSWSQSKFRLAHKKAENLIKKMISNGITVDIVAYKSLMRCYRNSSSFDEDVAQKCEEVLQKMVERSKDEDSSNVSPDVGTYTIAIETWSRSGNRNAAVNADKLLDEMIQNDTVSDPTARAYRATIKAWSKSRHPKAASNIEKIMNLMEKNYAETNNVEMLPSCGLYAEFIGALCRSQDKNKAKKAATVLKKAIDDYKETGHKFLRPNEFIYCAVINTCAFCKNERIYDHETQQQALKIAFAVLKSFENDGFDSITSHTYSCLLKATRNLVPRCATRDDLVEGIFEKCKSKGIVDETIAKNMIEMCEESRIESMFGDAFAEEDISGQKHTGKRIIHLSKLPSEWTINTTQDSKTTKQLI